MNNQALQQLFVFTRDFLAPIGKNTYEYDAIFDGIALGRLDLVGKCLRKFISRHHGKISLQCVPVLLQAAKELEQEKAENLLSLLNRVAQGQKNLGFARNRVVA